MVSSRDAEVLALIRSRGAQSSASEFDLPLSPHVGNTESTLTRAASKIIARCDFCESISEIDKIYPDPAQKRRAQVREAQKAYRSRQLSQVTSLKARVKHLEDVLDGLGQSVRAFDVQVIQGGSQWPQPRLFRAVKMLCDDLASQYRHAGIENKNQPNFQSQRSYQITDDQAQIQTTPSSLIPRASPPSQFWTLFMSSSTGMMPSVTTQSSTSELGIVPCSPTPTFETNVIPYTVTPFTQRLFRACAESGLRFLSNPSFKVADMWPEFGLLLQKMPRAEIREYFTRVVSVQPCNPVIDPRFPYISLGGSGTHFLSPSNIGSEVLQMFERTNGVHHVACDEQWFDVHDVERYLTSQGIVMEEAPSSALNMHHSYTQDGYYSSLALAQGASNNNMMMVVDEYKLVNSKFTV